MIYFSRMQLHIIINTIMTNIKITLIIYLLGILFSNTLYATNTGKNTFDEFCASCHTGGLKGWFTGAPEIGKVSEWQKFFNENTLEKMQQIVINGENDHKTRGGCKKCTDSDINAAINYLTTKSK